MICSAFLLPSLVCGVAFSINFIAIYYHASRAIPFGTMVSHLVCIVTQSMFNSTSTGAGYEEVASRTSRACRVLRWACGFQIYMPNGYGKNGNKCNEHIVETGWIQRGASRFQICMPAGQVDIFHVILPCGDIDGSAPPVWIDISISSFETHFQHGQARNHQVSG